MALDVGSAGPRAGSVMMAQQAVSSSNGSQIAPRNSGAPSSRLKQKGYLPPSLGCHSYQPLAGISARCLWKAPRK